jgi:hypothetical protein
LTVPFSVENQVVPFRLAIPATTATNPPPDNRRGPRDIGEIAVAEQKPKPYILSRHNEI